MCSRHVLVVDGDEDSRTSYVAALTFAGFRCLASAAPDDAIGLATKIHFDVVIMDPGLPRLADGLALARHLSSVPDPATLIAVSRERIPAMPLAFRIVLSNPVDPDELVDAVRHVVEYK